MESMGGFAFVALMPPYLPLNVYLVRVPCSCPCPGEFWRSTRPRHPPAARRDRFEVVVPFLIVKEEKKKKKFIHIFLDVVGREVG